tara:strand:- start:44 stop:463 length:420 start_codon:yes stop_codon:yes gene_type:complete
MKVDFLIFSFTIGLVSAILFLIIGLVFYSLKRGQDNQHLTHSDLVNCRKNLREEYSELPEKILDNLMDGISLSKFHELAKSNEYRKLTKKRADELFNDLKTLNFNVESSQDVFEWAEWYSNAALVCACISLFSFLTFFL